jgi:PAS domain-containing protein
MMDGHWIIERLRASGRLQRALLKFFPLNLILLLGAAVAPWQLAPSPATDAVFAFTVAVIATACIVGWSLVCVWEEGTSPWRDLLTVLLYLIAIGGMRHLAPTGQFLGYTMMFSVCLFWLSFMTNPRVFLAGWILAAVALFGPPALWPAHYSGATTKGLLFIFITTSILCGSVLIGMRLARRQYDEAQAGQRLHDAILEGSGECYVCVDADGIVREYNASAAAVFGRTAQQVIGAPAVLILSELPILPGPGDPRTDQTIEGVRADGNRFSLQCFAGRVERQGGTLHPLFMHDISSRLRRDALRRAQYDVTNLISSAPTPQQMIRRSLRLTGQAVDWDGMLLLERKNDHYQSVGYWLAHTAEQQQRNVLSGASISQDDAWMDRLRQSGSTCDAPRDLPSVGPLLAELGAACVVAALTTDGAHMLLAWADGPMGMDHDDLARADYLGSLGMMAGQISQYLARRQAERQLRMVQTLELNDDVVQALSVSFMYRDHGDLKRADEHALRALEAARRILSRQVLASGEITPGQLRRQPSTANTHNPPFEGSHDV